MKLAVVHYHLNRGGVTRVIENQLLALDAVVAPGDSLEVALLYGGRRHGWPEDLPQRLSRLRLKLHELPLLEYDGERKDAGTPGDTLDRQLLARLAAIGFAPEETVVHLHNHAVGKSATLPGAAARLAERGFALLLQIHDFAEDLRPANFQRFIHALAEGNRADSWHGWLYPQASHVHYGVLTGRDRDALIGAGVETDRVHLLPNPVARLNRLPSHEDARLRLAERFGVHRSNRFVLYPVRCIRRKNVGEALLYSRLAPEGTVVGLTLAPLNPVEKVIYAEWKKVSSELRLPCCFEVGGTDGLSFRENLAASDLILTTSVAEGFGMVFLESWLADRVLIGRDLPEITADFNELGVRLDWLRPQMRIPGEWVGLDRFRHAVLTAYRQTLAAYGRSQPSDLADVFKTKTENGLVDFADLNETMQQDVLRRICQDPGCHRELLDANRWIEEAFSVPPQDGAELIRFNTQVIDQRLSFPPSGRRLKEAYSKALSSSRKEPLVPLPHAERILDRFLEPNRFRLIRS